MRMAIATKYMPETPHTHARIRVFNSNHSMFVTYDIDESEEKNHKMAVELFMQRHEIKSNGLSCGRIIIGNSEYIIWNQL